MDSNRTINDEIQDMIDLTLKYDVLYPVKGKINYIYPDGCVNVVTEGYGDLVHVKVWGEPVLFDIVLVLFLGNNSGEVIVLGDYSVLCGRLEELEGRLSVLEGLVLDSS